MSITPEMVKMLRERTGAGMMDCKNALAEAKGDMEQAFELLRKRGVAIAAKKSGRIAADGLIGSCITPDSRVGVLVEVNCETDFVTKTDDFQAFVKNVAQLIKDVNPRDMDSLLATNCGGPTVAELQTQLIAKIGENLGIRRFSRLEADSRAKLAQYIHTGSKIGVLVTFDDPAGKLDTANAREVAMHVAAMHPLYVRRDDVPPAVLEKEKEIVRAQLSDTKKPPEILEKIVMGKIGKFFTEVCLDDQIYVRDPDGKATVATWLKKVDGGIRIRSFVRLQVGEGVEKKS